MSDMSEGPGWWLASDGKWYPPHLHPSVREDAAPTSPGTDHGAAGSPSWSADPAAPAGAGGPDDEAPALVRFFTTEQPTPPTPGPYPPAGSFGAAAPGPFGAPARAPRRHRALAAAIVAVVVLLVAVGAVTIFGGSPSASARVVDAVTNTLNDGTAHMTATFTAQVDGTSATGTGSGSIDFNDNAAEMNLQISTDGQTVPIQVRYLNGVIYEAVPGLSQLLPGKSWLSIDLSALQKAEAQDPSSQAVASNPAVLLQVLAQQGNRVVALGPSTVDGVAVNGYSVTVNTAHAVQQIQQAKLPAWIHQSLAGLHLGTTTLKVYIDDSGLLRSFTESMSAAAAGGTVTEQESFDLSAYGTPVSVNAPPDSQVESFEQLLQAAGNNSGALSG